MDIQVAGGVSPDAELTVVFAPDEPRGFYEAIYTALGLGSGAGDEREPLDVPTALSLSWGMSESRWAGLRMGAVDAALRTARLLGATVCCSSGDYGAANAAWGATEASVNFPASSPHVLACGGTTLTPGAAAGAPGEVAWNAPFHGTPMATGGGVSGFFPRPGYQHDVVATEDGSSHEPTWVSPHVADAAHFVGRGVPDVAAHADPAVGYRLVLGGVEFTAGGTSAATPLWAGLVALLAERLGRPVGWLNGLLYDERGRRALRDIVSGDNDITGGKVAAYRARRGWDACTGLGTPDGEALLAALQSADSSPAR